MLDFQAPGCENARRCSGGHRQHVGMRREELHERVGRQPVRDNDGDVELLGRSGELADAPEPRDLRAVGENHREVLWAGRGRPADQRAEQRERRK